MYRDCFGVHTLCYYPAGEANPTCTYPTTSQIEVNPVDGNEGNIRDGSDSTVWQPSRQLRLSRHRSIS